MNDKKGGLEKENALIKGCVKKLKTGKLPPWKEEEELEVYHRVII